MKHTLISIFLSVIIGGCSGSNNSINDSTEKGNIMEVTTFKINANVNPKDFNLRDASIESDFTVKQPGFLKRQSGLTENGEYVVIVFWESAADADASMSKFMNDPSVSDYAKMIDSKSMNMTRYAMNQPFSADNSEFVEIMTYKLKKDANKTRFDAVNEKVAKEVTAPRSGFVQRLTGSNDNKQIVAIYWTNKEKSDAAFQPFMKHPISKKFIGMMDEESIHMSRYQTLNSLNNNKMALSNKEKAVAVLESLETGAKEPINYINPARYIQHNLAVGDGLEGFGEVVKHAPPQGFKAKVIRAFEDGDYVFTHTEYDFFGPKIGIDVFRFENGLIVEHWDNLIDIQPANPSGRTQIDGTTEATDLDKTEVNKTIVKGFIDDVLLNHQNEKITTYINPNKYLQHNPAVADGLDGFGAAMKYFAENGLVMEYTKTHKVLGEGNFVLAMSEGKFGKGEHTAFYDLFRLENGQIVEHWDVISTIPPREEWKNENGKF